MLPIAFYWSSPILHGITFEIALKTCAGCTELTRVWWVGIGMGVHETGRERDMHPSILWSRKPVEIADSLVGLGARLRAVGEQESSTG